MTFVNPLRLSSLTLSFLVIFGLATPLANAEEVNLITNPSFETAGTTGSPANWTQEYWGTPAPTFKYPDAGSTGGSAASITLSANSSGGAYWAHEPVAVTAGETYNFENWYKSNVATEIDAEFSTAAGKLSYASVKSLASSNDAWAQSSATVKIPAGVTKMTIYQIITKKGNLSVDSFSLTKAGSTTPPTSNPPTLTLSASPLSIMSGENSTITWSSTDATTCTASNGWSGSKNLSGTQSVSPTATTTYTLSCSGNGGSVSKDVIVSVKPLIVVTPPPTLTLTASPATITSGESSTVSWSSTNATSCTASNGWSGSKSASGSQSVSPITTTTYALSCSGDGGSVSKNVTVIVKPVVVPPNTWTGMVTFSFDDSWISQYTTVLPILQAAGIKGTFYITTEPIQKAWEDFITPAQLKDIAKKGHEIGDHTITHPHLPKLSQANIKKEITDSKTYIEGLIGTKITTLAYPFGESNATVKSLAKAAGYATARGVDYDSMNTKTTDKYNLFGQCIEKSTPFSEVKKYIDQAKANKQWYIMCIHEVKTGGDEYSLTPTQFQQIVDYVKSSGVKTVTVKEGSALMN